VNARRSLTSNPWGERANAKRTGLDATQSAGWTRRQSAAPGIGSVADTRIPSFACPVGLASDVVVTSLVAFPGVLPHHAGTGERRWSLPKQLETLEVTGC
jgi:hypothetical protein